MDQVTTRQNTNPDMQQCDVQVRSMQDPAVLANAKRYGIKSLPAVVINGQLADCCKQGGIDLDALRNMGLGQT
jgi:glutaredoxin 3